MKTIYFLRHAEAASPDFSDDHSRELTSNGQKQVEQLSDFLKKNKQSIELVMCSAAIRTQETLEGIRDQLTTQNVDVSNKYYNIGEEGILNALQEIDDQFSSVLYVGHNPGITFAAFRLCEKPSVQMEGGLSPCTIVGIQCPAQSWSDVRYHTGIEIFFWKPV